MAVEIASAMPLLQPLVALNVWTFVMEIWMYAVRLPAVKKYDVKYTPQFNKNYFYSKIPPEAQWPGENYNHLMEQPTQYYALLAALIFLGDDSSTSVALAWTYVGVRMVHSVIHAGFNNINLRSQSFRISSLVLVALCARAVMMVF